ncbi:S4 domain-containing protein [Candidatus Venteria ishoeyi]|uniref:RNA-binding S4 domain-containing protein n=1 Tax=Candidatus Venteria ishoeyi TaxID=1899563 RepID=UPI0025A62D67|nr:S4 domain-containing protein [Candidatus Venteria ishoeyi]MDM8545140.1 S4 domain-containing protein [Candidatus Venteria ishoeyi]
MAQQHNNSEEKVRLDKWLWAARFFKTRSLATDAITGGKVHLDGQRIKPSKAAQIGQTLTIRTGFTERTVVITALAAKRGSATIAQQLYQETPESIEQREQQSKQRQVANLSMSRERGTGRPTKKDRRKLQDWKKGD